LAAIGNCAVILAMGMDDAQGSEITDALLAEATKGGDVNTPKAEKAVRWMLLKESDDETISTDCCGREIPKILSPIHIDRKFYSLRITFIRL